MLSAALSSIDDQHLGLLSSMTHKMFSAVSFTVLCSLVSVALAATYSQTANHVGTDFLNSFTWQAISDPTHGRVYVGSVQIHVNR